MLFNSKNIPLYIYDKKKQKYLRTLFQEKLNKFLIKESERIYLFFKKKKLVDEFNSALLKMHLMYEIRNQNYHKIRDEYLHTHFKKSFKKSYNYKSKTIYVIKKSIKLIFFFIFFWIHFIFPKKKKISFDVVIQNTFSNYKNSKENFPYKKFILRKKKFTSLHLKPKYNGSSFFSYFSNFYNEVSYINFFQNDKNNIFFINNLKNNTFRIFKSFILNPYKISLLIDFIIYYYLYFLLFKFYKTKIFIHSLSFDDQIPSIRQAAEKCNVNVIGFKRSNYQSKTVSFLCQPEEILFDWGKNDKELDQKSNVIKKKYKIFPSFFLGKKIISNIKKNYTVITIFDTTFNIDGFISRTDFNKFLNVIFNEIIKNKKLFLQIKLKGTFYNFNSIIDINNNNLLNEINIQKRVKIFEGKYLSNNNIIANSDFVCSVNSLTIGYEALANKIDSLTFCNKDHNPIFIKKMNNIYFFATCNIDEFSKIFKNKINNGKNIILINKLHKYFFSRKLSNPVIEVAKYL
jgi:hypothetical protein